ncbi:hypothetical protein [Micromonospora chokoriensis]
MSQQKRIETALDIAIKRQKEIERLTAKLQKARKDWEYADVFPMPW